MRILAAAVAIVATLWLPSSAGAGVVAIPSPFGHVCTAQNGVFFCPTASDSQRVPSFDGVPLDVDVTLPAAKPPYPAIVMLHGFPGTKASFEATSSSGSPSSTQTYHYNNVYFAQRGYAVINYSARGFGRSCGDSSSRTAPACNRGWFHFADQRWEAHDTQFLLSTLADEGIVNPGRIGVTGTSYGGGQSMELAFLRDRIRMTSGALIPWKSPGGKSLHISAAWPRWGWSDFLDAAAPNGRFLDYRTPGVNQSIKPIGVPKQSVLNRLYLGGVILGYLAPAGADPTADLGTWKNKFLAGEPYGSYVSGVAKQFIKYKSALSLGTTPAPLLVMNGWTDPIFPVTEALRAYNYLRGHHKKAAVSLQLGDVGHFRAGNALGAYKVFNGQGSAFFDHYLKGQSGQPKAGSVTAMGQGCPKGKVAPGKLTVSSYSKFARGDIHLAATKSKSLGPGPSTDPLGKAFDPVSNGDPCSTVTNGLPKDSLVLSLKSPGFTLAGATTISATIGNNKKFGQIDARLWDVTKSGRRLIDIGTYRLKPGQKGQVTFQLFGNEYTFAKKDKLQLELVGHDAPMFLRDPSFKVSVSNVTADIPTRDKPSAARGILPPPSLH
ncbi:MAG: alpha/beta fold hydrolase [Actinobacteria bacterium]|nr:alpha/beta fold hydrolase [Actinomycetota bacterium]